MPTRCQPLSGGTRWPRRPRRQGFSLPELLVASCLGLLLWGVVLRLVLAEGDQGARLTRMARERLGHRRTLELMRGDLRRAARLARSPEVPQDGCPMAGRQPVLHLLSEAGAITYAIAPAPSPIWRGRVLLRCGPAFGLYGEPGAGDPQNRVLLDGLSPTGFTAVAEGEGLLRLRLEQQLALAGGGQQRLVTEVRLAAPLEAELPEGPRQQGPPEGPRQLGGGV